MVQSSEFQSMPYVDWAEEFSISRGQMREGNGMEQQENVGGKGVKDPCWIFPDHVVCVLLSVFFPC